MVSIMCTCEAVSGSRVIQSHAVVDDRITCMICHRPVGTIPYMKEKKKPKKPKKGY